MLDEDYIFCQKFGYGIYNGKSRYDNVDEIFRERIEPQPTFDESSIIKIRRQLQQLNKSGTEQDKMDRRKILQRFEFSKTDKYLHVQRTSQFINKITDFWSSSHLCISDVGRKFEIVPLLAQYEARVITPNIFKNYEEMLFASAKSLGMMIYLSNIKNVDPNAREKRFQKRNAKIVEDYSRELAELHTLTPSANYTQDDIINLCYLIAGWDVKIKDPNPHVRFNIGKTANRKIYFLGQTFYSGRPDSMKSVITFLARHPKTAENITAKMFRYFISDDIDRSFHQELISTWVRTNGNLGEVTRKLMFYKDMTKHKNKKILTPHEWCCLTTKAISAFAGPLKIDYYIDDPVINKKRKDFPSHMAMWSVATTKNMGQPLWSPPSPKGYDISNDATLSAERMAQQLDAAHKLSKNKNLRKLSERVGDDDIKKYLPQISEKTLKILNTVPKGQKLSALFIAPEFMRR